LLAGIVLVHVVAAAVPWLIALDMVLCASLSLLIIAMGARAGREQCWGERTVVALRWEPGGRWRLERRDGEIESARLLASSYLQPQLAVLCFVIEPGEKNQSRSDHYSSFLVRCLNRGARWRAVVLMPDSVDAEALRRLRVRVRLEGIGETKPTFISRISRWMG
jgi:hypothetical protein